MDSFLQKYCSPEWQEFVNFHIKQVVVEANNYVFREGEKTEGLYIVATGKVKVVTKDIDKKDTLIRLAADGDILGHRGFGGNWTYPISAITYETTTMSFIPLNVFKIIAKANTEFTYQLMMFFAEELRRSEEKILNIPVKNRVANAILINYKVFGSDSKDPSKINYTLSRKDYASKARTTYETVIRVITLLNNEGIIKSEGKSIKILDLEKLKLLAVNKIS